MEFIFSGFVKDLHQKSKGDKYVKDPLQTKKEEKKDKCHCGKDKEPNQIVCDECHRG